MNCIICKKFVKATHVYYTPICSWCHNNLPIELCFLAAGSPGTYKIVPEPNSPKKEYTKANWREHPSVVARLESIDKNGYTVTKVDKVAKMDTKSENKPHGYGELPFRWL